MATPVGVDRTIFPSLCIRLLAPVIFLILLLGTVRFSLNRVPSENGSLVYMNAPEADMSLVLKSNTCFLSDAIGSIRVGRVRENLSYCRRSFIDKTLFRVTGCELRVAPRLNSLR